MPIDQATLDEWAEIEAEALASIDACLAWLEELDEAEDVGA